MKRIKGLLQIGGFSKSAGKTTLCMRIIQHFACTHNIIGVKISAHPLHTDCKPFITNKDFSVYKENDETKGTDTAKMLKFGALNAYYIYAKDAFIRDAFEELLKCIRKEELIVCESNSLSNFFKPDLLLMCKNNNSIVKPSAKPLEDKADMIINTENIEKTDIAEYLKIEEYVWHLNKLQHTNTDR